MRIREINNHPGKFSIESGGFTLVELVVVVMVLMTLVALAAPALGRGRQRIHEAGCISNLRQIGTSFAVYLQDNDDSFPDRRDLKTALPGGYAPWTGWHSTDPRAGWAAFGLQLYSPVFQKWRCPGIRNSPIRQAPQATQKLWDAPDAMVTTYWLWRFDSADEKIPLNNFWGKHSFEAIDDLRLARHSDLPTGPDDVELAVDPYFPTHGSEVPEALRGRSLHPKGYNRLFLDGHVEFLQDPRVPY